MKTIATIAIAAIMLQGCVSTTANLKADPGAKMEFTTDQPYQLVYKNLLTKMRDCLGEGQIGMSFATMIIRNELYPDLGTAEVSQVMENAGVTNYYMHFDIVKLEAKKTSVTGYTQYSINGQKFLGRAKQWAIDSNSTCR